jgi:type I restriction enzyme S subunit
VIEDLKPYPEYKNSGSKWLSTVPSHWDVRKLRNLTRSRSERNRSDLPLLSVAREKGVFIRSLTDPNENHNVIPEDLSNYKVAHAGSLVINKMKAWQGSMGIAPIDGIVSPAYYVFDLDLSNRLFAQALLRSKPYVALFAKASDGVRVGQWDLFITGMRAIPVLIPPPDEQTAIARVLAWATNGLDRAIGAKRRIIALLQEQKQAIIHRAVTRGLDPAVPLKDSGIPWLGEIPEHWEVRKLKKISPRVGVGLVINPSSYYVDNHVTGAVPMLLGNNIAPMALKLDRLRHISHAANEELPTSRLYAGDIVVVRVGAPGLAAVVPPHLDGCNCASVMIIRAHSSYSSDWLALSFNSSVAWRQIDIVKYGAAQKQFNIGHAVDFLFPVPPLKEQQLIVDYIATETLPISKAISRVECEITLLREYRTRLIADVVTGKLDVREVAKGLPEEELQVQPDVAAGYDADEAEVDAETDPIDNAED